MTARARTEAVIGGLVTAVDAIKMEPGEVLVLHTQDTPSPEATRLLMRWIREHLDGKPVIVAVPGADVQTMTLEQLGFEYWGSECLICGNATHASARCELCGSTKNTRPLWQEMKK